VVDCTRMASSPNVKEAGNIFTGTQDAVQFQSLMLSLRAWVSQNCSERIALPELRKDPITGRMGDHFDGTWEAAPNDFLGEVKRDPREEKKLPFLRRQLKRRTSSGNSRLPGRNGGRSQQPGWSIRVVPHKFPALGIEGELDREERPLDR